VRCSNFAGTERSEESPCPITGGYEGRIPDAMGLCARMTSNCRQPEVMYYSVSDCKNPDEMYEGKLLECPQHELTVIFVPKCHTDKFCFAIKRETLRKCFPLKFMEHFLQEDKIPNFLEETFLVFIVNNFKYIFGCFINKEIISSLVKYIVTNRPRPCFRIPILKLEQRL